MECDRCRKTILLIKPIHTCNIVRSGEDAYMHTYILCKRCLEELEDFLDPSDRYRELEEF